MMLSLKRRVLDQLHCKPYNTARKLFWYMKIRTLARPALLQGFCLIACAAILTAQSRTSPPRASLPSAESSAPDEDSRFGSSIREMTQRSYFERLDAEHKQNIKRAGEGATIASDLLRSFNQNRALSAGDIKNLEKLEKIARRIRAYAGGSGDDRNLDSAAISTLGDSLSQVAELSLGLQQEVEGTARQVVSAKLIADANRVISLVRHARSLAR